MTTGHDVDALARALIAERPRAVDPEALSAVDADELSAALRQAVAGLAPEEQRTRLAAAFRAISMPASDAVAEAPPPPVLVPGGPTGAGAVPSPAVARRRLASMPSVSMTRAGLLAGVLVVALLAGALVGTLTQDDRSEDVAVPAAAEFPVAVLEPIGFGDEPPSNDYIAGLLPPDPQAQAEARRAAIEEHGAEPGDASGIDPDDVFMPEIGDADIPISGYADAPATGDDDSPRSDGPQSDAGGDTSGGGPTASDDSSDAAEPPGVVDLCAVEEPLPGCEGVAGTVTLAQVEAFRFNADPEALIWWPGCFERQEVGSDQFVIWIQTNTLGSFTARYRPSGTDAPFVEVNGESPESWRGALAGDHAPLEYSQVQTCLVADRPGPEAQPIDLEVTGTGVDDTGTATWSGTVNLDAAVAKPRHGRPTVTVTKTGPATLRVDVPLGPGERAEVAMINNTALQPRYPEPDACSARAAGAGNIGTPLVSASPPGGPAESDWTMSPFRVGAGSPGDYLICVDWYDDFEPPRHLERVAIPVSVDRVHPSTVASGYVPVLPEEFQPDEIDVTVVEADCPPQTELRGAALSLPSTGHRPAVLCTHDADVGRIVTIDVGAFRGDELLYSRPFNLPVPEACRSTADAGRSSCTTWFSVPVVSGQHLAGVLIVGLFSFGEGPLPISEHAEFTADTDADAASPRLSRDRTTVEATGPTTMNITWEADAPGVVDATLTPFNLPWNECPVVHTTPTEPATSGVIEVDGLCPGTRYDVVVAIEDDAGRRTTWPEHARPSAGYPVATPALQALVDYEVRFRIALPEGIGTRWRVVPRRMYLRWGADHAYEYSQFYDGHAYVGLECDHAEDFNLSGSDIPVEVYGTTFGPPDASFDISAYASNTTLGDAPCPNLGQQLGNEHFPGDDPPLGGGLPPLRAVRNTADLDRMLEGRPAVFKATRPWSSRGETVVEVELIVHLRPDPGSPCPGVCPRG